MLSRGASDHDCGALEKRGERDAGGKGANMPDDKPTTEPNATRVSKLLPADLTAAFLSAKAGLISALATTEARNSAIFWTFVGILVVSPLYFYYVAKARNPIRIGFLSATFVVFAISIADKEFSGYLTQYALLAGIDLVLQVIAIVLPILWVFLIAPIILERLSEENVQ